MDYTLPSPGIVDMIDIPTYETKSQSRKSGVLRHIDGHELSSRLDLYSRQVACAFIEEPGAMPKQGLSSTFRFGYTCGVIQGVLAGHMVAHMPISPAAWKLALGLTSKKDESFELADRVYSSHKKLWSKKMWDGRAEAALLAHYGIKFFAKFIKLNQ